jgi:[1-hydroxy-2-(trimethylamino)ethyl]phosphonate dioxygenase
MSISDVIFQLFEKRGSEAYFGEAVSMLEHSLQAAHFARRAHAPDTLVVAALLHDIGHLIEDVPGDIADWHTDAKHEEKGAAWLARHFGPEVCNPVRLHVPAKRYLCATDARYVSHLSAASVVTLKLQGGPMNAAEIAAFEREAYFKEAVRVRRWDDSGKVAGLETAGLDQYRKLIEAAAETCVAR